LLDQTVDGIDKPRTSKLEFSDSSPEFSAELLPFRLFFDLGFNMRQLGSQRLAFPTPRPTLYPRASLISRT